MARKRMIDPSIWDSEEFGELGLVAQLLFIGMISHADDEGRGKAGAKYLRKCVFPYSDEVGSAEVAAALGDIARSGLSVRFYRSGGHDYYEMEHWSKWQTIQKPTPSNIPAPPEGLETQAPGVQGTSTVPVSDQYGTATVPLQYQYCSGTVPLQYEYDTATVPLPYRYGTATVGLSPEEKRREEKRREEKESNAYARVRERAREGATYDAGHSQGGAEMAGDDEPMADTAGAEGRGLVGQSPANDASPVDADGADAPPGAAPEATHAPPGKPAPKGRKKAGPDAALDARFDAFWASYPRKVDKKQALGKWRQIAPSDALLSEILASLAKWRAHWEARGDPQYIPHPTTWLNRERWLAEPPGPPGPPTAAAPPNRFDIGRHDLYMASLTEEDYAWFDNGGAGGAEAFAAPAGATGGGG